MYSLFLASWREYYWRSEEVGITVQLPEPPSAWGRDELTNFIDHTRRNCFASYANRRTEYGKLSEIDAVYRRLNDNLNNSPDWFAAFFLFRSHSAFLAGCHLGMAGQAAEAYAALRLSLEYGLYGFYLARKPASAGTWLRRHDSSESKRRVRREFAIVNLLEALRKSDRKEAALAEQLYERCIDYGGHPNERALTQSLAKEEKGRAINFRIIYLSDDPTVVRLCLNSAAQVGPVVLGIFRLVYKERFDISGLSDQLAQARQGL